MSDELSLSEYAGVLTLTLNRPAEMNALNSKLLESIEQAMEHASASDHVGVVVITGAGRAFCAGADLLEAEELTNDAGSFGMWLKSWQRAFGSIGRCPKPVIAAINGVALAGGLELALACDVIVASDAARLGDGHIRYGLVPGGGGSKRLPDAVGSRRARWLMFTGEVLGAASALEMGLVQQVFASAVFAEEVQAVATTIAGRSPAALASMKTMTASSLVTDQSLADEIESAVDVVTSADAREGLAAFRAKREPRFPSLLDRRT
jgi:enoyl-CoA hydratase/carnithine racemase